MNLSREEVEKVALLSRLLLSDDELETMTRQLGKVLGYVQQLEALDTTGVEPMAHAMDLQNVLVDDQLHESLPREEALAAATDEADLTLFARLLEVVTDPYAERGGHEAYAQPASRNFTACYKTFCGT